ncbi:dienelactone hydrolase family protein [Novosphingobium sp. ZN18A2]|uniref:dienelactone hydrolase family protein n=1 Tax=Novosphingobium sp. ZN18A2 TaxID=3079861 RepID=UPI0030D29F61
MLERIEFRDRETALTGWLCRPAGKPRAAVLVFPTIANLRPAIERRAQMLADAGYLAMIADFYGEVPQEPERVRALADSLRADVDHYRTRLSANLATLAGHDAAKGLPVAAIGFCMGGQAVLELARAGQDLKAVAIFHGILSSDRPARDGDRITPRILVCHGDKDPLVPREQVAAFEEEMDAAGAFWHLHVYSNARHGFTDPESDSRGMDAVKYDASADRQSWAAMLSFFDEIFG